jgi:hypothetical protein
MEKNVYINNLRYIQSNINEMLLEADQPKIPPSSAAAVGVFGILSQAYNIWNTDYNITKVLTYLAKGGEQVSKEAARRSAAIARLLSRNPTFYKRIILYLYQIPRLGNSALGSILTYASKLSPGVAEVVMKGAAKGLAARTAIIGGIKSAASGVAAAVGGSTGAPIAIVIIVAVALSALIGRKVALNKSIAEALANVKSAKESGKYKDFQKYITSLRKIRDNDSFWSKLTTAQEARDISDSSLNTFKKGYITIGICMILCSIISLIAFSFNVDTFKPLIDAVKKLDWKGILVGIGKIVAITALAIPAVIGVAMIFVGMTGFPEKGAAPAVLAIFSPVVQLSNNIIGRYMESLV